MSQENVEVVRRLYSFRLDAAGMVRGDFDNVFLDYFHADVEIVPPLSYPDIESSYRGQEGVRRWFQQMDEPRPQRNRIHFDISVPHDEARR